MAEKANEKKEEKKEAPKEEKSKVEKKEEKPEEKKVEKPKEERKRKIIAEARGKDLSISPRQAMAICRAIKGKTIDEAIDLLILVSRKKRAIKMKGEIPHRKGMMSGRYPIKASKIFIKLLRSLGANANINGLDLEKARIYGKADRASRPPRGGRLRRGFKRANIYLILKEIDKREK